MSPSDPLRVRAAQAAAVAAFSGHLMAGVFERDIEPDLLEDPEYRAMKERLVPILDKEVAPGLSMREAARMVGLSAVVVGGPRSLAIAALCSVLASPGAVPRRFIGGYDDYAFDDD